MDYRIRFFINLYSFLKTCSLCAYRLLSIENANVILLKLNTKCAQSEEVSILSKAKVYSS